MSYSKMHDNFLAVYERLSPDARQFLSIVVSFIDQNGYLRPIQRVREKRRKTITESIIRLTGLCKSRTSRLLKSMVDSGVVVEYKKFHLKFSEALIRKNRKEFASVDYKLPIDMLELRAKAAEYFEPPTMHKGEDQMNPAIKKRFDELQKQNEVMLNLLREIAAGLSPSEAKEKAECHLRLVKEDGASR